MAIDKTLFSAVTVLGMVLAGCSGFFPGEEAEPGNGARQRAVNEHVSGERASHSDIPDTEQVIIDNAQDYGSEEYSGTGEYDEVPPLEQEYESAGFQEQGYE